MDKTLEQVRTLVLQHCGERMDEPFDPSNPLVRPHGPTFVGEEI